MPTMLTLSLLWATLGLLMGALARGARLWPRATPHPTWRWLLAAGTLAGLLGGWLGALVFGRFYGVPNALWIASAVLVAAPPLLPRVRGWRRRRTAPAAGE